MTSNFMTKEKNTVLRVKYSFFKTEKNFTVHYTVHKNKDIVTKRKSYLHRHSDSRIWLRTQNSLSAISQIFLVNLD